MEEIRDEENGWWRLTKTLKDNNIHIYEFWHKPVKDVIPKGRYIKYIVSEDFEFEVIEDGPYLG